MSSRGAGARRSGLERVGVRYGFESVEACWRVLNHVEESRNEFEGVEMDWNRLN